MRNWPFIASDSYKKKVMIFDGNGKMVWDYGDNSTYTYDVWMLPNNNVLFADEIGVKEVTLDSQVVWEFSTPGEVYGCQRLANDNTLVADCTNCQLLEVNSSGEVAKTVKLTCQAGGHGNLRHAVQLENGNYLVAHFNDRCAREYTPDGTMIAEFPAPGPVFDAVRTEENTTLMTYQTGVLERNSANEIIWDLKDSDVPEMGCKWWAQVQRLENGNTVVTNWLGHGQEGTGVLVFEVTPDKQVVWQFNNHEALVQVSTIRFMQELPPVLAPQVSPVHHRPFQNKTRDAGLKIHIGRSFVDIREPGGHSVSFYDIMGKEVLTLNSSGPARHDLSGAGMSGIYVLHIGLSRGEELLKKIFIHSR